MLKILSVIGILGSLVFSLMLGQATLIEGKNIINPYIDTVFGENYTPNKFDQIKIGMKKQQVLDLIGNPLNTSINSHDSLVTNYNYTGDGKLLVLNGINNGKYGDFAWYRSIIGFDKNNIVVYLNKGWSYD